MNNIEPLFLNKYITLLNKIMVSHGYNKPLVDESKPLSFFEDIF